VAARSKTCFCGRSLAGIAGSDLAGGMDVWSVECCLRDGPIPRPEGFYRVCVMESDQGQEEPVKLQ
jgi:hypothetical protein